MLQISLAQGLGMTQERQGQLVTQGQLVSHPMCVTSIRSISVGLLQDKVTRMQHDLLYALCSRAQKTVHVLQSEVWVQTYVNHKA